MHGYLDFGGEWLHPGQVERIVAETVTHKRDDGSEFKLTEYHVHLAGGMKRVEDFPPSQYVVVPNNTRVRALFVLRLENGEFLAFERPVVAWRIDTLGYQSTEEIGCTSCEPVIADNASESPEMMRCLYDPDADTAWRPTEAIYPSRDDAIADMRATLTERAARSVR